LSLAGKKEWAKNLTFKQPLDFLQMIVKSILINKSESLLLI